MAPFLPISRGERRTEGGREEFFLRKKVRGGDFLYFNDKLTGCLLASVQQQRQIMFLYFNKQF